MFDWIDDIFTGVGNTFGSLYQGVSSAFGNIFGAGAKAAGSAGATIGANQLDDIVTAYTRAGYSPTQIASFIGTATGTPDMAFSTVENIIRGGGSLTSLPQASFSIPGSANFNWTPENVTNLIKTGVGLYGLATAGSGTNAQQQRELADPYAPYRADAAKKLNELINNPGMVYSLPGYQARQQMDTQQLARLAASQGIRQSGTTQAGLQQQYINTANDWFNNYVNQLSKLSGATQSPTYGQEAGATQTNRENISRTKALETLMQSVGGLVTGGFFG